MVGLLTPLKVYEIDPHGDIRHALTVHPVEPMGVYIEGHVQEVASRFHETDPRDLGADPNVDLPWFLQDLKPAGFLGRAWLRAHPDLGFPTSLVRWTGDDVLRYATLYGTDLTGAFVLGPFARDRLRDEPFGGLINAGEEARAFPALAERAREGAHGSLTGGEQPKFTATLQDGDQVRQHIVKFSPPLDTPGGRRWADLLLAEHLTHQVLADHGIPAARSRLLDAGRRRFLAVERFDRCGANGRSGLCSLLPFDRQGVAGDLRRWSLVTQRLVDDGHLTRQDHETVQWLEAFGHLIANTDMHLGNLSVHLRGTTITGLAPVYDMLPMFHAPRHGGELPTGVYQPDAELGVVPGSAREAALDLWNRVLSHSMVSEDFRDIGRTQRAVAEKAPS
ncbi:MAG: HipA domain-containing protein [Deltaproteobacteria bacterium]|nr:HipA domain-containing protein [Deltaproteobacteria bacterium]